MSARALRWLARHLDELATRIDPPPATPVAAPAATEVPYADAIAELQHVMAHGALRSALSPRRRESQVPS